MRTSRLLLLALVVVGCSMVGPDPSAWRDRTSGDGWLLIAKETVRGPDRAYVVHAATDLAGYRELWRDIGLAGLRPDVDMDRNVVVSLAHGIGSSCPELRLDDVVIDGADVYSVASDPILDPRGSARPCTADLVGAVIFVVAIDSEALPEDGFTLWLTDSARHGQLNSEPLEVRLP
jgi:hypothetical protein